MHHSTDAARDAARQVNADRSRWLRASHFLETALGLVVSLMLTGAAMAATVSYEYDALGRLTRVGYSDGKRVIYRLDAAGNRTQVTSGTPAGVPATITVPSSSTSGSYTISWGAASGTVTAYQLYESTNSSFSGQQLDSRRHGAPRRALGPRQRHLLLPRASLLRHRVRRLSHGVERRDGHHHGPVRHPGAEPVDPGERERAAHLDHDARQPERPSRHHPQLLGIVRARRCRRSRAARRASAGPTATSTWRTASPATTSSALRVTSSATRAPASFTPGTASITVVAQGQSLPPGQYCP